MLVKSGIDYSNNSSMYEQTKSSLRKFKSDTYAAAGSPDSFSIIQNV